MGSKWFSKIGIALAGIAMAVGVGVVAANQKEVLPALATGKDDWLPNEIVSRDDLNGTDKYILATTNGAKYSIGTTSSGKLNVSDFGANAL